MLSSLLDTLKGWHRTRPSRIHPKPMCFGRDGLCDDVVRSAFSQGCVLLFGGRQSGKTTALRHIAHRVYLDDESIAAGQIRLPVYVDLMRLPYDATPGDVFGMLAQLSVDACAERFPRIRVDRRYARGVRELEAFEAAVTSIRSSVPDADLRFAYLLDESKRVIGDRFPRGFHDNLFHVLFGDSAIQGVCQIVFAGAQELYRLCEDDTSPIGSRAAKHCLTNLSFRAVQQMAAAYVGLPDGPESEELAKEVYVWTGGHAGLSAGLLRALRGQTKFDPERLRDVVGKFRKERSELFQLWVNSLTVEARTIHDALLKNEHLSITEAVEHLRRNKLPVHRVDRVVDELQYVGFAQRAGDDLGLCNRLYSDTARLYACPPATTELERSVWALIEQTELGLRKLVRNGFEARWKQRADDSIRKAIGEDAWAKVIENRDKYVQRYSRTQQVVDADEVLNFAYFAQLGQLMMWSKSWDLFKHLFRDKREFEDMVRDIVPVRNDSAHFRSVPDQELNRCRVRCIDLLAIVERNQHSGDQSL